MDLRQKVLQRDERISELKEQLAAKSRSMEDLRRRTYPVDAPLGRAAQAVTGSAASTGGLAKPTFRSRSPSPNRVSCYHGRGVGQV